MRIPGLYLLIGVAVALVRGYGHHLLHATPLLRFVIAVLIWPYILVDGSGAHHWIIHHIH